MSTAYWIIFRSTKSEQFDDFWWFLSSIEYRSNIIFGVFHKNQNFRVFQQNLIRLPFDRSPKSSETSHSRCCEINFATASKTSQMNQSDEFDKKIRKLSDFLFQTQCDKRPLRDFGIQNSMNFTVVRVRL